MEQVPRDSRCDGGEGACLPVMMAAVGALQRGRGGGGSVHGGGARVRGGAQVSGGVNDPDVCGL
jgi:hypothetical protein